MVERSAARRPEIGAWLEHNRLADHLHLIRDGPRYAFARRGQATALIHEGARDMARAIAKTEEYAVSR
jgi:hypothetical protein